MTRQDKSNEGVDAALASVRRRTSLEISRAVADRAELIGLVRQYRDDMRFPPAADSRDRRLEWIERVLTRLNLPTPITEDEDAGMSKPGTLRI